MGRVSSTKYMTPDELVDVNAVYGLHYRGDDDPGLEAMRRRPVARERHATGGQPKDLELPMLLPGIKVNTSPDNFYPIRQMQLATFNGESWELFGDVISG